MKTPKTQGLTHIALSVVSFNGSGYADRESPEDFLESYKAYKKMKNKPESISDADIYRDELLIVCEKLIDTSTGPSRTPTKKNLVKFSAVYPKAANW